MNKNTPAIIAIDGTAASGKGTLARRLGALLGYPCLDTGKLYRYVGVAVLDSGGNPDDDDDATRAAERLKDTLQPEDLRNPALETDRAGQAASKVARFPGVRNALLLFQKNFAAQPPGSAAGAILDGRDIGTVICPEAPVKIFVTADVKIRAQRRHKELQSKGISVTYDAVLADMLERDARDAGRKDAPMKPAGDALMLDTSEMSIDAVLDAALAYIKAKLA
jgi:cytidylate kinase